MLSQGGLMVGHRAHNPKIGGSIPPPCTQEVDKSVLICNIYIMNRVKCALCGEETKLCASHIIPEFFYKSSYQKGKEKLNVIPLGHSQIRYKQIQQGMNMPLLCSKCEAKFSKYESYFARLTKDKSIWDLGKKISVVSGIEVRYLSGLNYFNIKYLMLSIIWRMSFPYLGECLLDLGPYQEKLRDILITEKEIDERDYPIYFGYFKLNGSPSAVVGSGGFHRNKKQKRNHLILLNTLGVFATIGENSSDEQEDNFILKKDGTCVMMDYELLHSNLFGIYQESIKKISAQRNNWS